MKFSSERWSMCDIGSWLIHSSCILFSALAACNSTPTAWQDGGSHVFTTQKPALCSQLLKCNIGSSVCSTESTIKDKLPCALRMSILNRSWLLRDRDSWGTRFSLVSWQCGQQLSWGERYDTRVLAMARLQNSLDVRRPRHPARERARITADPGLDRERPLTPLLPQ